MTIQEYFGEWWRVIPSEELWDCLQTLKRSSRKYTPEKSLIFKAFEECSYSKLKVMILGQDPYPQKGVATGLAFGNNSEPLSPSLEVIKEACIDYTKSHYGLNFDNSLKYWANQGVLLLNSALTCEINKPGSHMMLWRKFIAKLLRNISYDKPDIICTLLGEQAQTFEPYIIKGTDIIKCKHPSYYARTKTKMPNIFNDINKLLYFKTCERIEWFTQFT